MSDRLPKHYLRRLRNHLPIRAVIADILGIAWKISEGRFRFLCPLCHDFHTATNPDTNLARCFRCEQNFNPIDLTMTQKRYDFRQAVALLDQYLDNTPPSTLHSTGPRPAIPDHQTRETNTRELGT